MIKRSILFSLRCYRKIFEIRYFKDGFYIVLKDIKIKVLIVLVFGDVIVCYFKMNFLKLCFYRVKGLEGKKRNLVSFLFWEK